MKSCLVSISAVYMSLRPLCLYYTYPRTTKPYIIHIHELLNY